MPVATFPGERNWGYDGLYTWAPHPAYGGPEGLAALVDAAHAVGLGVILDVVYNHLGPGTEALEVVRPLPHRRLRHALGRRAVNFDGRDSGGVREWAIQNACMWVRDFHVDGLRVDAVHADLRRRRPPRDGRAVRPRGARRRRAPRVLIAESDLNDPKVVTPAAARRLGLRRAVGRRLPPRAARAAHRRARRLLRRLRHGGRPGGRHVAALRLRRALLGLPPPPPRRPGRRDRARALRGLRPEPRPGGQPRARRPPAGRARVAWRPCGCCSPPSRRCSSWARSTASERPFQFFTDHIDPFIADATRERPPQRVRGVRRASTTEVPDPQDPGDLRALGARPGRAATPGSARSTATCWRCAAGCPARTPRCDTTRTRVGWACVRGDVEVVGNFGDESAEVRVDATRVVLATGEASTLADGRADAAAAAAGRWCDEGLAGAPVPARRDLGRPRHQLLALLRERVDAWSCACSTRATARRASS